MPVLGPWPLRRQLSKNDTRWPTVFRASANFASVICSSSTHWQKTWSYWYFTLLVTCARSVTPFSTIETLKVLSVECSTGRTCCAPLINFGTLSISGCTSLLEYQQTVG